MDNLNLYHELEALLRMDNKYCMDDGTLIKNKIVEDALNLQPALLNYLLSHEGLKNNFFRTVGDVLVFDKVKFQQFVVNKSFLPDSYTAYKNKVGLATSDGHFVSESREVVLAWPYKDCVLEGGQTKEDAKRDEVFWSEVLAPEEITRLTEPKALSCFIRYDRDGGHQIEHLMPTDNFIIRGNNLLALYSLRNVFAGSIKLIYIDPPYNTGNDSFGYNDRFNHSTWLTFMRNRLIVARDLLRKDGTLCISIDHNEIGYCLALTDEIFGKENLKNIITVKRGSVTGAKVINPGVVNLSDYVVIYSRNSDNWKPNRVLKAKPRDDRYNQYITNFDEPYEHWNICPLADAFADSYKLTKDKLKKTLGKKYDELLDEFVLNNAQRIIQFATLDDNNISQAARELKSESKNNPEKIYKLEREGKSAYYVLNGKLILFASDRLIEVDGKKTFSEPISDIWDDVLPNDLHNEGGVIFKKGKKQEKLLQRIIQLTTNEGDWVLDYHLGSGTTTAVALKSNRRFIGIEQIDYGDNDSIQRMQNVIGRTVNGQFEYDTRGISPDTNWQGGGSFVYCELGKANDGFIERIKAAENATSLKSIWADMKESGFLSYKIKPSDIDATSSDFDALCFEDQKRFLIECLDKNMIYIPYGDMNSSEYSISEDDRRLTQEFYSKN